MLKVDRRDGVATVTLNRPEKMNALSNALRRAICDGFTALQADEEVEVAILTGAGRAFCAGLDLKELGGEAGDADAAMKAVSSEELAAAILGFDRPLIGAINGVAITGGFEIALMCDILIGSTEARFADTHARVGIMPGWGLSQRLPRLIGVSRAKELHFTGNYLDAATAERWGLLNRVLPPEELLPFCLQVAQDMRSCVPGMVRKYKRVVDEGLAMPFGPALEHERAVSAAHRSEATPEAVRARRASIQDRGRSQQASG
ncbi:MAG: enoyl-CoA hydratase [Gemmataceae bacterium]|nr:enoyl-CoA hydratase [Gemmataceae bacterium]